MGIYLKSKMGLDVLNDVFLKDLLRTPSFKQDSMLATDIKEGKDNYIFEMDIPGFEKKDISVFLEDGYLTVEVLKVDTNENEDDVNYLRRERKSGKYTRTFYIGNVENDIKANYENGILKVIVPKKSEEDKKKTIIID